MSSRDTKRLEQSARVEWRDSVIMAFRVSEGDFDADAEVRGAIGEDAV